MTDHIIRAVAFANGVPCPHAGQWVATFDHDAYDGRGYGTFTDKVNDAKRFHSNAAAFEFWRRRSRVKPTRPDGKPNRPLTALSVVIEPLP